MLKDKMEKIYSSMTPDEIPWHLDTSPEILRHLVETGRIPPCRVIELGCGTGNCVMYLAKMGFDATGVDFSETAIEIARTSVSERGIPGNLIVADLLGDMAEVQDTFDFAFDWELLHHLFPQERDTYIHNVHRLLRMDGTYLSVCFSDEDPGFGGTGKYRETPFGRVLYFSSEDEIAAFVEPLFEIDTLETVEIRGKVTPHRAIYMVVRKR